MRIAIWHNLSSGGAKRALFDGVRELSQRGHELEAWCPPSADMKFLPLAAYAREHIVPLGDFTLSSPLAWTYRKVHAKTHMLEKVAALEYHNALVAEAVNTGGFDLFFATTCQWLAFPTIGPLIRIPSVLYLQEPYRFLHEAAPELPWIEEADEGAGLPKALRSLLGSSLRVHPFRILARRELLSIRAFDRVLVNSLFSRESVLRACGIDSRVCYLGVDPDRFHCGSDPKAQVVLCVGQLHRLKNPEFVIRAIASTRSRPILRWVCNVVHDEDYRASIEGLARSLGVSLDLRVGISDEQLVQHYQDAMMLVYAPRLEPFGYAPLEANACGTPVVAVAEGGVRETVVDGVNGVPVSDEAEMAAAIDRLMEDPVRARALGNRGSELVRQRWSLAVAGDRLEQELVSVAAASRRAGSSQ